MCEPRATRSYVICIMCFFYFMKSIKLSIVHLTGHHHDVLLLTLATIDLLEREIGARHSLCLCLQTATHADLLTRRQ